MKGERPMKVIYYRHNRGAPPMPLERQPFAICELTLVTAGALCYHINGQAVHLGAGDAIFVTAGSVRERPAGQAPADYVSFNFQTTHPPALPLYLPGVTGEAETALIAAADAIDARHNPGAEMQMRHLLLCLLCGMEARSSETAGHPLVRRIRQYVEEHLGEKITLDAIGEATFFSPVYCEAVFKQQTGQPVMRYVTSRRMAEAEKLLLEGALSLRQVAEQVGYADYNYFARIFKKVTGRTPTEAKTSPV